MIISLKINDPLVTKVGNVHLSPLSEEAAGQMAAQTLTTTNGTRPARGAPFGASSPQTALPGPQSGGGAAGPLGRMPLPWPLVLVLGKETWGTQRGRRVTSFSDGPREHVTALPGHGGPPLPPTST